MNYKKLLGSLLLINLFLPSCKAPNTLAVQQKACEGVRCTRDFKTITIVDANGKPVQFNSAHGTTYMKSILQSGKDDDAGVFTLIDDSIVSWMPHSEITVDFGGVTKGGEKVHARYKIGTNCCHVYLISGPEKIVVP